MTAVKASFFWMGANSDMDIGQNDVPHHEVGTCVPFFVVADISKGL